MRGWLLSLVVVTWTISTSAQSPEDVWVVPVTNDAASAAAVAEGTRRTLRDAGFVVPAAEAMRERFEAAVSRPAPELAREALDEWSRRSTSAVRHLARADYEAARADLAHTHALTVEAAEELNREPSRAQRVLDTCLYLVRALLETGDTAAAEREARGCRLLVPRVEPNELRHTPEVREVLGRVDAALAAEPRGRLSVRSEPSGCAVRLAGVEVGRTPLTLDDLPRGAYGVQVECEPRERGRVRRVEVNGDAQIHVDARFDRALGSRPIVHARGEHALEALRELGRRLGVSVVALEPTERGGWTARLVEPSEIGEPIALGLRGEAHDFVAHLRGVTPSGRVSEERSPAWLGAGLTVVALGLGAYAGGIVTHRFRANEGDDYVAADPAAPDFLDAQDRWLRYQLPTHLLAYAGGTVVALGLALALPERDGTPWWAWLSGVVGVTTAAIGAALVATLPDCGQIAVERRACVNRGQGGQRTSFVVSTAIPLLAVPLTYLFGRGSRVRVEGSASARHATLGLRGTF